jgi:hypothetical protein
MESILTSTKKLAGLTEDYEHFDPDIVMYINSVFLVLWQLGVGPSTGFSIEDESAIWEDFIPDNAFLRQTVKAYMGSKVRLKFDPPTNSALLEALKADIAESEWRLSTAAFELKGSGDVT